MSWPAGSDGIYARDGLPPKDPNAADGEYPVRRHIKPKYRLTRNWVSGSKCSVCKTTGLYEDLHPVNPCPRCGAKIKELVIRWEPAQGWDYLILRYLKGTWVER